MALAYFDILVTQNDLIAKLDATEIGAPFSRISRIEDYGVKVELKRAANLLDLMNALDADSPGIVAVNLLFLPYSYEDFDHAVLVVGANEEDITLLDPATKDGTQIVSVDAFIAAWTERDCALAIISQS